MELPSGHAAGFAGLFGNEKFSDCDIVFVQACSPKKQRLENGAAALSVLEEARRVGAPLPAHQLVLAFASAPLSAQLEQSKSTVSQPFGQLSNGVAPQRARPQLVLHVDDEKEVESARAAIKFVYSGSVSVCSVRDALLTRRHGLGLQLKLCSAACDDWIVQEITHREPASVLELYACQDLWPDPKADPSFKTLLAAAKPLLVAHFGDALSVMSSTPLQNAMLELPATALEVLLSSDDFGTDSESSVLLLLAAWMQRNYDSTHADTRLQLRRTVRLTHLGLPYMSSVLTILAHEYESGPASQAGWFPLGIREAIVAQQYANTAKDGRRALFDSVKDDRDLAPHPAAFTCTPRRQCIPAEGLVLNWTLKADALLRQISKIATGDAVDDDLAVVFESGQDTFVFEGLYWSVLIDLAPGGRSAGCYARVYGSCDYEVAGSRLGDMPLMGELSARLVIRRWADEGRKPRDIAKDLSGWYCTAQVGVERQAVKALPLRGARSSGASSSSGDDHDPLAPWVDYLRDDQISGTLTLQRPAVKAGGCAAGTQKA